MDPTYYGNIHLHKNIIQVYGDHFVLAAGLTNLPLDTSGLVNYEVAYKPIDESYLNKNEDDELYLTNCQYQRGGFKSRDLRYHRKKRLKEIEMVRQEIGETS